MNDQQTDPTLDFLEQQFPSSQSMTEMEDLFSVNPVTSHDQDLAPSSVESRGNSRSLGSSQSTPVPVPIERETQPSDLLPLTNSSSLPRLNIQRVDVSSEEVKAAVVVCYLGFKYQICHKDQLSHQGCHKPDMSLHISTLTGT
ncbi:hypothetical protein PCANC_13810 [Puccinia coronata f. sp. avenae]|uniref:Uncharacterized protein n=1 Tax=Puccinia coronata f. sp. avenae TaxID=200324 RepID=A0A2N5UD69_9BASI|nr:hypothetical protein PCANC_13810 [Puccinia coronata f. sp. avenae]